MDTTPTQNYITVLSIAGGGPSVGTGTLLMALAHQIGNSKCTIFAQDISQRSNKMLKCLPKAIVLKQRL